jgi:hypothetical protein
VGAGCMLQVSGPMLEDLRRTVTGGSKLFTESTQGSCRLQALLVQCQATFHRRLELHSLLSHSCGSENYRWWRPFLWAPISPAPCRVGANGTRLCTVDTPETATCTVRHHIIDLAANMTGGGGGFARSQISASQIDSGTQG